ncbi:tripartite motif-containing protein 16-like isoform X2 [Cyprinodon tularosa]|uniref:tripartite motif-containing protein 16-like isoform X2 n=1 Tax=Cyprinodon tularosa TaxID=77115 RepID=UPI0018E23545|nr:tripartite motif-containing protein 16-like isoform X2 [Cyprinodon tularosa]
MAQKRVHIKEEFYCLSCFDPLKYPVTIPCGHNFCINCIKTHWEEEEEKGIHSCPQCRKTFNPGFSEKTTPLTDVVELLKKIKLQAVLADNCHAGSEYVACDFCTGSKMKAISFCFVCSAFYCEGHVHSHNDDPPLKRNKVLKPSKNLQKNICSQHDEAIDFFCRTDQKFICSHCLMNEHRGHHTVSAATERSQRQRELEEIQEKIQQGIQDREKDVKLLKLEVDSINHSADKTVENCEVIFSKLIRLIQEKSSYVKQQIRSQQETEVSRVKELQEKLEQEITELKKKEAELKQLLNTEDHNQFLHSYPSLSALSESTHSPSINIRPLRHFEDVTAAVSELRDNLQDILRDTWKNISLTITEQKALLSEPEPELEPNSRDGFLKYACEITFDPNTAHGELSLSEGNRKVTYNLNVYGYRIPDIPSRFNKCEQVLSRESLTGRCYWEVEWTDPVVTVAVAYKNIRRVDNGSQSRFGYNDRSWALDCFQNGSLFTITNGANLGFWHNNARTPTSGSMSSRIGVYLDHSAGILSFYSVSETMTLLHRVQTTFTQPLYAGLYVELFSNAEFCEL